ncbi:RecB-family nuclease [Stygiolobus caldivivus]|uniref:Exonuclease n=1 Tax=Stygiolobus caldivivus TaxID=2824673 RepID=A0A8D5ZG16_9CREN|nr:RecB-family nuclease [Stygiolobus caldivivus]BCU70603.1 exonuclease [Stygiolobus caldivivus]
MPEIFVVLHNVSSVQKLIDFVKFAFNLDIKYVIVTKIGGVAAQAGVPEASKLAYRMNKTFLVLPDLKDAIELFVPDSTILISQQFDRDFSPDVIKSKKRIMLVFPGIEAGFTKIEQSFGETYKLPLFKGEVPPVASLALISYMLSGEEFKKE